MELRAGYCDNISFWYYVRMKKIVLIALVLLVMVGCSETAVDTPSFADGQATALAIDKINEVMPLVKEHNLARESAEACAELLLLLYTHQPNSTPTFTEEYQGLGVWIVDLTDSPRKKDTSVFKWKVYESTATVESVGNHELDDGTTRRRYIC